MKLSSELRARAEAVEKNPNYSGEDLSDKTIIGITAPFATGKSTVTHTAIEMLQDIGVDAGLIGSEMTRQRRPDDPDFYTTEIPPEELVEKGERGELINLSIFPTGEFYATSPQSIPHEVNIGPLMPASLHWFEKAGCKAVHAFYLTTTPTQWQEQLDKDRRLSRSDVGQRLYEAINSLEYALNQFEHPRLDQKRMVFIENDNSRSVEQIAGSILYRSNYQEFKSHAYSSNHYVREMYSHAILLQQKIEAA